MDYSYTYSTSADPSAAVAGGMLAIMGGFFIVMMIFAVAVYVYFAVCLMKMATKTGTANSWFAWIPILNMILMLQIARKPVWWVILFFIPLVNIVISILVWMAVAESLGKPSWLGILMIVPVANLIIPGYLAFSNGNPPSNYNQNPNTPGQTTI